MKKQSFKEELIFLLIKTGIVLVVGFIAFGFVFGFCRVDDNMMKPAIKSGDLVLYYRLQKDYEQNNVVVLENEGEIQVRRIIARGGDVVDMTEQGLIINGYLQQESEIYTETYPFEQGIRFPMTVEEDKYFVLGDDRVNAKDSRIYGTVHKDEIKGVVMTFLRRRGF